MKGRFFHPASRNPESGRGLKIASYAAIAIVCTIIGILIASNLDLPARSVAQGPASYGQTSVYPVVERNGEYESPFVQVVEKVQNAVVNISAKSRERDLPWYFYGGRSTSSGSGFFFRDDGYLLTNNHVVADAEEMTVRTASGYEYKAQLVGADPATDLAVLKVEPEEKITTIPFGNSEAIKVGDWAIAIGNPFPRQGLDRSVTVGVISAVGRSNLRFSGETPAYQNYIQTDASINPGNSGGPLLNLKGECIGVNAAISSPTGTSVGIGFAIPINLARAIVPDLIADGRASRGWLGVILSDVTERQAKREGLSEVKGVVIDSVFSNSPAGHAGIKSGDIVVGFDGKEVVNSNQFSVLVSTVKSGMQVPVEVLRGGHRQTLTATIADRDAFMASSSERIDPNVDIVQSWLGMELFTFTARIARELGIDPVEGVYVARVYPGSPADRASIAEGTIIMQVNDNPISSIQEINEFARQQGQSSNRVVLIVQEPNGTIARKVVRP